MSTDPRATDGQATLEWLALVALVVTLLGLGAALAQAGSIGRRVTREMARAFCVVRHGDCRRDQEPCVTYGEQGTVQQELDVVIVRLGRDSVVRIEQRSDGTVAVTKITGSLLGLAAGIGGHAKLRLKGVDVAVGGSLEASGGGTRDRGRTWIVDSWAAARDLLDHLASGPPRPPDLEYDGRGLAATLGAGAGVVKLDAAQGSLSFDGRSGTTLDHRTGHRTIFVRVGASASAALGGGVLGLSASAATGGERYAVELDAAGRPIDLQVVAAGTFAGSRDLPDVVQPVVGMLETGAAAGRGYEVTAHLDLTEPENLAAARDLLAAVTRDGWPAGMPSVSRALRRRIDEDGTVEARVLQRQAGGEDVALTGAVGGKVGAAIHTESASARLLVAASRGLDGRWLVRADCGHAV